MKSLLLWLTPFLFLPVFAQKADVKWGSAINSETFVYDFLAESDGKFFTLSGRKDDLYLERYSSTNFTQDYSKELEVPELNGKKQDLEMICFLKDRFLLFTSLYDKKANLFTVSAYNVSREGMIAAKPKEILTLPAQSRNEGGEVEFVVAGDSTNILVVHRAYLKKEKKQRITLRVIDGDLKTLSTAIEEFAVSEGKDTYVLSNYIVNVDGEIFFLQTKITPAKKKIPAKYAHSIVRFGKDGKRLKNFPITSEGNAVDRVIFSFDVNNNLVVSGSYVKKTGKGLMTYPGLEGIFFMNIDKNSGLVKSKSFHDIEQEILESYYSPKQRAKATKLLPNDFLPKQIIRKEDGGLVTVYEQFSYAYSEGKGGATEMWYYGDLLVTNINPDGTIKWVKLVPKRQLFVQRKVSLGVGVGIIGVSTMFALKKNQTIYYSYLLALKDDKMVFVFNDDPLNKDIRPAHETEVMKKIKGAVPVMVTLTESGSISKKTLFEATDFDVIIRPRIAFQSSDTRILLYGSKGDTDKFGVMNIE